MNKVELIGRLCSDPDTYLVQGKKEQTTVTRLRIAVDRRYNDETQTDFFGCVAFGKRAEFIDSYIDKGARVGIVGHLQTNNYEDSDGVMHYNTDVVVDEIEFCESKSEAKARRANGQHKSDDRQSNAVSRRTTKKK